MISVRNLHFSFGHKTLLKDASFELQPRRIYCLLGENGAGKSTLLKALAGHYPEASKTIFLNNQPLGSYVKTQSLQQYLMFLPQMLSRAENFTCREFVATAFEKEFFAGVAGTEKARLRSRTHNMIHSWQLEPLQDELLHKLSGGEWRRTQLAFAFCRQSPILILDEPDGHLDFKYIKKLADECRLHVKDEGLILMATHNFDFAQSVGTDFLFLKDGSLHHFTQHTDLHPHLKKTYGVEFEKISSTTQSNFFKPKF